jgi:hypothetical protein
MSPREAPCEVTEILLQVILPFRAEGTSPSSGPILEPPDLCFLLPIYVLLNHLCLLVAFLVVVPVQAESVVFGEAHYALRPYAAHQDGYDRAKKNKDCLPLQEVRDAEGKVLQLKHVVIRFFMRSCLIGDVLLLSEGGCYLIQGQGVISF